ncbi:MAG: CoA transferase, partial [Dehalococcoidia bacterium]
MAEGDRTTVLPLKGLRVLNFGWYWVCAVISHILADMGAEAIKIESWQRLEILKSLAPFLGGVEEPDRCMWAHNLSRNNLGITVDLQSPRGRDLIRDLVRQSDVVAENWTPGTMKKLGLDYESLREIRPDLIMISPSAAGQWGPLHQINTYGSVLSPLAGIDGMNGYEGERPVPFGMSLPDPIAGVVGAYAVLAALRHRNETGEGRYIDFSQWEAMTTTLGVPLLDYHWNRRVPGPMGNRNPIFVPHNVYPCVGDDSWVSIAVYSEQEWQGLCRALGDPPWRDDPRFADKFRRKRNEPALDALIGEWTRQRTHYEVAALLQAQGVAAFPASSARDVYTDPHWKARDAWVEMQHLFGSEVIYGLHLKFSDTPGSVRTNCPLNGEHNARVFGELLGVPEGELA